MESGTVLENFSAFKSGVINKLNCWDNMLLSKENKIKELKEQEKSCKEQKEDLEKTIPAIQESLTELELQKLAKLEADGVSQKLSDLNSQIKSFKCQQGTNTSPYPECTICLEVCNPSQGRLVCCCPQGHTICGQCADKVDKCPTCRRAKSSFGGAFTRVREYEGLAGKTFFDEDCLTIFERISELVFQKMPLEQKKEQVEKEFDERKAPFEKELSEAKKQLEAMRKDILKIKEDLTMAEKDLAILAETSSSRMSQIAGLTNYLDVGGKSSKTLPFSFLSCSCALSCPHPLLVEKDGRIWGEPCGCIVRTRCQCITHQITLDLAIERGSSGPVTIDLAGRTNPGAVSRLYRSATENFYAGLIVHNVRKNDCIDMGLFDGKGKKRHFTSFTPEEKVLDATDRHLLNMKDEYCVGIREDEEEEDDDEKFEDQQIKIYMKNSSADCDYRTVGIVTEGFAFIEKINNWSNRGRRLGGIIAAFPLTTIKKSSGRIVTPATFNSESAE